MFNVVAECGNKTKLFCIIGMPARHSLSPAIHNAGFKAIGLDAVFLAFDVPPSRLGDAIRSMPALEMPGMTLTSPHKLAAMSYMTSIDTHARELGAVNTVLSRDGRFRGYNTDAPGSLKALETAGNTDGKRIVIIGAGGFARALAFELMWNRDVKLTLVNRTVSHAEALAASIRRRFHSEVAVRKLDRRGLFGALEDADILVNGTNITLENSTATPVPKELLKGVRVVFDANYAPLRNRLVRDAEASGCKVVTGDKLLLYQGVVAFKLFTGVEAPVRAMEKALSDALGHGS